MLFYFSVQIIHISIKFVLIPKYIMGDWSALPRDVLACFTKRLTSLKDYNAFRAVCTSWRWAATKENFTTSQQVPWHVAFCVHHDFEQTWRFHILEKNKVHLCLFNLVWTKHICSSLGWMMTMRRDRNDVQNNLLLHIVYLITYSDSTPVPEFQFTAALFVGKVGEFGR